MTGSLTTKQKDKLDGLLIVPPGGQVSNFTLLKKTPGPPELKYIREWAKRLEQLDAILDPKPFLAGIPHTKVRQFAAEAAALEAGDLRDIHQEGKRHALILCLLHQQRLRRRRLRRKRKKRQRKRGVGGREFPKRRGDFGAECSEGESTPRQGI